MTRLVSQWISEMETEIQAYDKELKDKIGLNLAELAAKACGMELAVFYEGMSTHKIAAIPITSGEGIISTFSESVAAILRQVGGQCFTTEAADVDGMYEAINKGADLLFMADDDRFIALNIKNGKVGDNNLATVLGYVTALETVSHGLAHKPVLVLGCGIIGRQAVRLLEEKEAVVTVWDKNPQRLTFVDEASPFLLEEESQIRRFNYIFDATNTGEWLLPDQIGTNIAIAAPGVPLSLTKEAMEKPGNVVVHDMLQIGTAVMLGLVI